MEVKGKKYEVLEILKKSRFPEQDLYVCLSEYGYKECFQGFDISQQYVDARKKPFSWTLEEKNRIRELLKEGKTPLEISRTFKGNLRTEASTYKLAYDIRKELLG